MENDYIARGTLRRILTTKVLMKTSLSQDVINNIILAYTDENEPDYHCRHNFPYDIIRDLSNIRTECTDCVCSGDRNIKRYILTHAKMFVAWDWYAKKRLLIVRPK
jgi:hypothetical protein